MSIIDNTHEPSSDHPILGSFEPIEDLLYHDCPYVFTFRTAAGELAVAYLAETGARSTRYLTTPITEAELRELKAGNLPLRAIYKETAWEVCLDENAEVASVSELSVKEIAPSELPPMDFHL